MVDLLNHTLVSVHNPKSGRFDALRLADTLAISTNQMAQILGSSPSGLRKNADSEKLQAKLEQLTQMMQRLKSLMSGRMDYALIWLKAPHPDLAGQSPLHCLEVGRFDAVEVLLHALETGQPL
jgi:hypothetical protein